MKISFTAGFQKKFGKLSPKIQKRFAERMDLFQRNPDHPFLKAHPLKGNLAGYRSSSITGDYRVMFRFLDLERIELVSIGTHSQIY
jgi:addiction module RelE/StbE family toxin